MPKPKPRVLSATSPGEPRLKQLLENPFERIGNSRAKHEVVNRRAKGSDKNVAKARLQSVESRRSTLMQEYKQAKKANSFEDRRFGEKDTTLTSEQKTLVRFRTERIRRARKAAKYNLDDNGTEELLTHQGKALNLDDYAEQDDGLGSEGSDDGGELHREIVDRLHFGGGRQSNEVGMGKKKSKADMLEEMISKSKLVKLEKAQMKDLQEDRRERLDASFEQLVSSNVLHVKPTKKQQNDDILKRLLNKRKRTDNNEDGAEAAVVGEEGEEGDIDDYDKLLTEMVFEARAQATDRTKTPEELAKAERARLEQLEKERLIRMRGDRGEADDHEHSMRRASKASKRELTDDDLEDEFESGTREMHAKAIEDNEQASAAWRFFGSDESDGDEDEEEDDDEDDEDAEEGDEEEDGEDDDQAASTEKEDGEEDKNDEDEGESDDVDEESADDPEVTFKGNKRQRELDGSDNESEDEEDDDEEQEEDEEEEPTPKLSRKPITHESISGPQGSNSDIPYLFAAPTSPEELNEWLEQYGTSAGRVNALLERIKKSNSIHLSADNKHNMHNYYDMLLKRFIFVGDQLAVLGAGGTMDRQLQLDFLAGLLFDISHEMPDVCVSIWARLLVILHERMAKRLRDYAIGERERCWPSIGTLLLLKLASRLFSVTDFRHAIITPTLLLLGQCLTHCPVNTLADLRTGMVCCGLMIDMTSKAQRYAPEAIMFVNSVLVSFLPTTFRSKFLQQVLPTFAYENFGWLKEALARYAPAPDCGFAELKMSMQKLEDESWSDDAKCTQAAAILSTIYRFMYAMQKTFNDYISLPELMDNFVDTLAAVTNVLPSTIRSEHMALLQTILEKSEDVRRHRGPLQWRRKERKSIAMVAPRFDENYAPKKDATLPKHKKEEKSLIRKVKREKKAAMRELRRDAEFVEEERWKARNAKIDAVKKDMHQNMNWLQEQQATLKQQVKQGRGLLKGGGSFVKKRARVVKAKR